MLRYLVRGRGRESENVESVNFLIHPDVWPKKSRQFSGFPGIIWTIGRLVKDWREFILGRESGSTPAPLGETRQKTV
jgi:hypothetical protein